MKIAVPKEYHSGETRVPLIPDDVKALVRKGAEVEIESGMGEPIGYHDADYSATGASVTAERKTLLSTADIILRIRQSPLQEIKWLKQGALHISYFDPFNEAGFGCIFVWQKNPFKAFLFCMVCYRENSVYWFYSTCNEMVNAKKER